MALDTNTLTVDSYICEFVGQPLLVGRPVLHSSMEPTWENKGYLEKFVGTDWFSANVINYSGRGWQSKRKSFDPEPWVSVDMGRTFIVKLVVFMSRLDCCRNSIAGATVRVGYRPDGINQPICAHFDTGFKDQNLNFMPCTTLIKGTFVTIQFHLIETQYGPASFPKLGAFGFPA